jgi:hypothetical protein
MAHHDAHHDARHPISDGLHPLIYAGIAISALWLMVAAWVFFGSEGHYAAYSVAIATGLFFIAGTIPYVIWQVWRHNAPDGAPERQPRTAFSDWWRGEMETWQGRVEGWDAAVEVLLPLGAAAIGMTLIGLVFRLTAG